MTLKIGPISSVIAAAEVITENCIPIVPCLPRSKIPVPRPRADEGEAGIHVWDDPQEVGDQLRALAAHHGGALNLSMRVGRQVDSPVAAVGLDLYKTNGQQAHAWAKDMGISSSDPIWLMTTGSGGLAAIFHQPDGLELARHIEPNGLPVDLLVNGQQVIPPSVTTGAYSWMSEHGPSDIDATDLKELPPLVVEFWQELDATRSVPSGETPTNNGGRAWTLLNGPITTPRNTKLTSIAGWLRPFHPQPVVQAMLLAFNAGRCDPPLDVSEVQSIVASVFRYPQTGVNGHPRAVVPTFYREE